MKSEDEQVKYGDQFLIKSIDNDEYVCPWFVGTGIYRLITDIGGITWTIQSKAGKTGPVSSSDSFLLCSSFLPTVPLYLHPAEKSYFDLTDRNQEPNDSLFALVLSGNPTPKQLTYDCEFQIRTDHGKSGDDGQAHKFWVISDGIIMSKKGSGDSWRFQKVQRPE
jgi:hypothetical protein